MPLLGLDEVLASLGDLQGRIEEGGQEGIAKGLQRVVRDAKMAAPVDTGELRQKILASVGTTEGEVRAYAEHAPYVEFGTGPVGKASGGRGKAYKTKGWTYFNGENFVHTRGQPARPFLYPAFKANREKIIKDIAAAIRRKLNV